MALPGDVTTFLLTFGPYLDATGAPRCKGKRGYITPTEQVTHWGSGAVILRESIPVVIGDDGTASVALPHVDQQSLTPCPFLYDVKWTPGRGDGPVDRLISVPVAHGPTADYDHLVDSPDAPGVAVPIAVGPRGFSAYELAVRDGGFAGTEEEWLASLVGPPTPTAVIDGLGARIDQLRDAGATDAELAQARSQLLALLDGKVATDSLGQPGFPPALSASGKLPTSVMPVNSTTERVSVADQAARLALTSAQVQPGDLAVQADDGTVWLLVSPDPSQEDSWVEQLLRSDLVTSVQGQVGDVVLTPGDVGADPAGTAQALAAGLTAQVGGQLAQAVGSAQAAATSASTSEGYASQAAGSASAAQGSASSAAASARSALSAAQVRGDDLYLTSQAGTEVNAGNVRGLKGDQGNASTVPGPKGDPGDLTPAAAANVSGSTGGSITSQFPSTRRWTLTGNTTVVTPGALASDISGTVTLVIRQAVTGGPYTLTWPAITALRWAGGAPAPVMPTTPGGRLTVHLFWSGAEWTGYVAEAAA